MECGLQGLGGEPRWRGSGGFWEACLWVPLPPLSWYPEPGAAVGSLQVVPLLPKTPRDGLSPVRGPQSGAQVNWFSAKQMESPDL